MNTIAVVETSHSLLEFFSDSGFMPHGHCYLWRPSLLWTHAISDLFIGGAYMVIAMSLYAIVMRARLPFSYIFVSFIIFIAACGGTHFLEVWNLWHADYWLAAFVKATTAIASVATGIALLKIKPGIYNLLASAELSEQRRKDLEKLTETLESQVSSRTLELQESEKNFRTLANSIPQLAWMAAPTGDFFWYNQRWYDYTGTTFSDNEGWKWDTVIQSDQLSRVTAGWKAALNSGHPWEDELRIRGRDGVFRWFLSRAEPVYGENAEILRWFGTNTDIEDQKRQQEELTRTIGLRDEFLSIASHELRTPVASLKLENQLLLRQLRGGKTAAATEKNLLPVLDSNSRQIDQLSQLIENMLDVSKISSGKLELEMYPMDLGRTIRSTFEILERQFNHLNIQISLEIEDGIMVYGDEFRLGQVMVNLLTNALKYGNKKPVTIRLGKIASEAVCEVQDQGIGIVVENRVRIFERFKRAINHKNISGLGLGLFICKEVIAAHGGRIWVEDAPGGGALFHFAIPLYATT